MHMNALIYCSREYSLIEAVIIATKISGTHNEYDPLSADWSKLQDKAEIVVLAPFSGEVSDFS